VNDQLHATDYQVGDPVIGEADGEKIFGVVVGHGYLDEDEVTIRWADEDYSEPGFVGHTVPAELIRLWPAAAHRHRVAIREGTSS
jgi:hypothetical protein